MTKKPLTSEELTKLTIGLNRMARNLWWTWDQEAQEIFQELSPRGWQNLHHNAVAILHEVSEYELRVRLQDHDFAKRVCDVLLVLIESREIQRALGKREIDVAGREVVFELRAQSMEAGSETNLVLRIWGDTPSKGS